MMEQRTLKNVSNYYNTNIYFYLEASGGQSSNQYLNVVHFFNTSVNLTSVAARTVVFLHWRLIHAVLLVENGSIWSPCFQLMTNRLVVSFCR